jgi:hypothetical protein
MYFWCFFCKYIQVCGLLYMYLFIYFVLCHEFNQLWKWGRSGKRVDNHSFTRWVPAVWRSFRMHTQDCPTSHAIRPLLTSWSTLEPQISDIFRPAVSIFRAMSLIALMVEAASTCETSASFYCISRPNVPEDIHLQMYCYVDTHDTGCRSPVIVL